MHKWLALGASGLAFANWGAQAQAPRLELMVVCPTAVQARWLIEVDQAVGTRLGAQDAGCVVRVAAFKRGKLVDFKPTPRCFFKIVEVYLIAVESGELPRGIRYTILCSLGIPES